MIEQAILRRTVRFSFRSDRALLRYERTREVRFFGSSNGPKSTNIRPEAEFWTG